MASLQPDSIQSSSATQINLAIKLALTQLVNVTYLYKARSVEESQSPPSILVIGHGRWGERYASRLVDFGALAGVVVQSESSAARCREAYQRPAFQSVEEALNQTQPKGVAVLSPTCWHVQHALLAIERKIPTMVIKPVAARLEGATQLKEALEKHQTPYFSVHEMVWMPAIERIKKTLEAGTLGELKQVRSFHQGSFHGDGPPPPMENETPGENLGFLYDSTMHEASVLNHLAGAPPQSVKVKKVFASVARPEILAKIDYGDGVEGVLEYRGDPDLPEVFSFAAEGSLGSVVFEATSEDTTCTLRLGSATAELPLSVDRPSHPIDAAIHHFEEVIRGATPAEGLQEGLDAMLGAELICRAAAEKADLDFDEAEILGPADKS